MSCRSSRNPVVPENADTDSYPFELEIYVERVEDSPFAEHVREELVELVREIAPWIELHAEVLGTAGTIARNRVEYQGVSYDAPWCKPSAPGRQTMLLTHDPFPPNAEGFGGRVGCVVSVERYEAKAARGESPVDITVHEWLHTIEGETIRARPVPYADDAERFGCEPDEQGRWLRWFTYALGGPATWQLPNPLPY
jgi:hypothetical protein